MSRVKQFATTHVLAFILLATSLWLVISGVVALLAARIFSITIASRVSQSLGTLAATGLILLVMTGWGWLRPAGVSRLGNRRLWLITVFLGLYVFVVYQLIFFGQIALDLAQVWQESAAQALIVRQLIVGFVEEVLFRGLLLYALLRVWGGTRRGLLSAITLPALLFGVLHILQVLSGNSLEITIMTIVNAIVGGIWLGALVLLGGSIWPAVLLHALGNATYQLTAMQLGSPEPTISQFALATLAETPLLLIGLWRVLSAFPRLEWGQARQPSNAAIALGSRLASFLLVILLISFGLTGCGQDDLDESAPSPSPPPTATPTPVIQSRLSQAERIEIFETVWQTVNEGYFDPTFGGHDWQAIGQHYRERLDGVEDDRTFWLDIVNPMLFELGVSHIAALPPELANQLETITFSSGTVGLDVRRVDDQLVITAVSPESSAAEAGLHPGYIVTALNGRTVTEIMADAIVSPPFNERNLKARMAATIRSMFYGDIGDEVELTYRDGEGRVELAVLRYEPRPNSQCAQFDEALPPACTELEVKQMPEGIGYLRFSGFLPTVLDGVLAGLSELSDTQAIIIDLRGNPGGVFPVRKAIASQLVGGSRLFMIYQLRDKVHRAYLDPVSKPYKGKVAILVDELSASSTEEFAGSLQAMGRATIIGTQTPGNCLIGEITSLPYDAILMYPYGQSQTPDGRILENNGVVPDITVSLSRESLLQGTDAQLQAAISFLLGDDVAGIP